MEKPKPHKTRSTLGLPARINAELMYRHGAASNACPPWMAITSDARAGILPKSNVTSKRKLSEKFEYTPHLIHKISTIKKKGLGSSGGDLGTATTTRRFVENEHRAAGRTRLTGARIAAMLFRGYADVFRLLLAFFSSPSRGINRRQAFSKQNIRLFRKPGQY